MGLFDRFSSLTSSSSKSQTPFSDALSSYKDGLNQIKQDFVTNITATGFDAAQNTRNEAVKDLISKTYDQAAKGLQEKGRSSTDPSIEKELTNFRKEIYKQATAPDVGVPAAYITPAITNIDEKANLGNRDKARADMTLAQQTGALERNLNAAQATPANARLSGKEFVETNYTLKVTGSLDQMTMAAENNPNVTPEKRQETYRNVITDVDNFTKSAPYIKDTVFQIADKTIKDPQANAAFKEGFSENMDELLTTLKHKAKEAALKTPHQETKTTPDKGLPDPPKPVIEPREAPAIPPKPTEASIAAFQAKSTPPTPEQPAASTASLPTGIKPRTAEPMAQDTESLPRGAKPRNTEMPAQPATEAASPAKETSKGGLQGMFNKVSGMVKDTLESVGLREKDAKKTEPASPTDKALNEYSKETRKLESAVKNGAVLDSVATEWRQDINSKLAASLKSSDISAQALSQKGVKQDAIDTVTRAQQQDSLSKGSKAAAVPGIDSSVLKEAASLAKGFPPGTKTAESHIQKGKQADATPQIAGTSSSITR